MAHRRPQEGEGEAEPQVRDIQQGQDHSRDRRSAGAAQPHAHHGAIPYAAAQRVERAGGHGRRRGARSRRPRPADRSGQARHRAHPPALPADDAAPGCRRRSQRPQLRRGVRPGVLARRGVRRDRRHAGEVLYAVPGSPMVAERTVELLVADDRVDVAVVPGLSFLDLVWTALAVDPVATGVRVVDGRRFAVEAAGERGPLLVAQCDAKDVFSDIKLAAGERHPVDVVVLQRLGLPDESVRTVGWDDLDREVDADHLTTLYLPAGAPPIAAEVARFAELVRTLRERCPWDREQTHRTLTRHLL
ncbi:MAG: hypothetical protein E6G62_03180, partial [Actinobacteria bacterium]